MALDLGELSARVTVDLSDAEAKLNAFERRLLAFARQTLPDVEVLVDTGAADGDLRDLQQALRDLPDAQADVDVDVRGATEDLDDLESQVRGVPDVDVVASVDTAAAERALDDLGDAAARGGADAGAEAGNSLAGGIVAAIATIPVAGAIVGIGGAIGASLVEGLQNEVREDRLLAQTGLDPATVARLARAAGEAYAGNFGASIEDNIETARSALQGGLLDQDATSRDAQQIVEQLSGVADILGEDVPRVARTAGVLLRTGFARDAAGAFDLLVKGAQSGANVSEDLLDTFTEYPSVLQRLGLSGVDALGLLSQGLQAGARDTDFVADALKEFQIRATDASETSARGFELIGLSAEGMTAKIAQGGAGARDGLEEVLDGLRAIEDPVLRNEAAVALFGTKAEDLGEALFALDLSSVADELGEVEGAASGAVDALGDNAAGSIESAQRNIEVAADGIKGALAEAFGPQIEDLAETVSGNREAVVGFLLDMANAGLDAGRALVEGAAAGTEAFGDFVAFAGPAVITTVEGIVRSINAIPGIDLTDTLDELALVREDAELMAEAFDEDTEDAAAAMRRNLIDNGIDPVQERLNAIGAGQLAQARFSDSTSALARAIDDVGFAADGSRLAVELASGAFDRNTEAGRRLDEQVRLAVVALGEQAAAGLDAGRSVEDLTSDYRANREALIDQLEAMGLTREEAGELVTAYGAIPDTVTRRVQANGLSLAIEQLDDLRTRLTTFDGEVYTAYVRTQNSDGTVSVERGLQRRAAGGPVWPGEPFLVGEDGPELVTFDDPGYVMNARQTASVLNGGYGQPRPLGAPTSPTTTSLTGSTRYLQPVQVTLPDGRVLAEAVFEPLTGLVEQSRRDTADTPW